MTSSHDMGHHQRKSRRDSEFTRASSPWKQTTTVVLDTISSNAVAPPYKRQEIVKLPGSDRFDFMKRRSRVVEKKATAAAGAAGASGDAEVEDGGDEEAAGGDGIGARMFEGRDDPLRRAVRHEKTSVTRRGKKRFDTSKNNQVTPEM